MSTTWQAESLDELRADAVAIVAGMGFCVCPDDPHMNAMHDLAHDVARVLSEASDGQANNCTHMSATGVDTAPIGPDKVWRCDHCGLTWTDRSRATSPTHDGAAAQEEEA